MDRDLRTIWTNCDCTEARTLCICEPPSETPDALGFTCPGRDAKVWLPKSQITVAVSQKRAANDPKRWFVRLPAWLASKEDAADLLDAFEV